jgi:hypothetical protein
MKYGRTITGTRFREGKWEDSSVKLEEREASCSPHTNVCFSLSNDTLLLLKLQSIESSVNKVFYYIGTEVASEARRSVFH